jgi:O-antigen ligase
VLHVLDGQDGTATKVGKFGETRAGIYLCPNNFTMFGQRQQTLKRFTPTYLALLAAFLMVASMPLSPFLLSVSMWFFVFAAWWHTAEHMGLSLKKAGTWWSVLDFSFRRLFANRALSGLALLLLVPALSFFWSDDKAYWLRLVQTRLPFLVMPWAFANFPPISERQWKSVLYFFVWTTAAICTGVGINFLLNYDAVLEGLGRGNPVPVPRSHVRFSLIVATSVLSGLWLWRQRFYLWQKWERHLLLALTLFLFVFLHVLSVRGGLFALYLALVFWAVREMALRKKWVLGTGSLLALVAVLWFAAQNVPSLRNRIGYMRYDWERFRSHDDGHLYSDGARWVSLMSGWQLWEQNPLLGTGAGDLLSETKRNTAVSFPSYAQEPQLPHNQFVFIMASTGLLGLLVSLFAFWRLLRGRRNALFWGVQVVAFASFLIECTLENAIGVAWYLGYTLWSAYVLWGKNEIL